MNPAGGAAAAEPARGSRGAFALGTWLLLALSLALLLWTYRDYGVTWDEVAHVAEGEKVLAWYASGFDPDLTPQQSPYGGLFHGSLALLPRLFPNASAVELRHLLTALVAWLGVVACARTASLLGSEEAGFYAALLLLTYPVYVGHAFANFSDTPFAAGYIASLYFVVRFVQRMPAVPWATTLGLGLAIGLTAAVRVGGLVLLAILGLAVLARLALRSGPARVTSRDALATIGRCAVAAAIAYATMIALWPWAQGGPFVRPLQALTVQPFWLGFVLFGGELYESPQVPLYFTLAQMLVQTPEIHLGLAGLGIFLLLRRARSVRPSADAIAIAVLLVAAAAPLAWAIARGARFFDSFRHFLFVVPPAMSLLGVALQRFRGAYPRWRTAALVGLGLGTASAALQLVTLHPFEYVYYNRLVGGVAGAFDRYELDYWGASYKELVEQLDLRLPEQGQAAVFADGPFNNVKPYVTPKMVLVWSPDDADYVLTLTRSRAHQKWQGEEVARVARQGAPLSLALRVRGADH